MATFGQRVRQLRHANGWSLRNLAEKVGVGFIYLSRVENERLNFGDYPSDALIHRLADLAIAVMRRFPKGGTFLDGALNFLPQDEWPELVRFALDTLDRPGGKNPAADSVIEYASLQCPTALHPHLDRIFVIRPNARCYYERYPWRESGDRNLAFL